MIVVVPLGDYEKFGLRTAKRVLAVCHGYQIRRSEDVTLPLHE